MAIPSRVLGSGNAPLAAISICGDAATGLTAAGTNAATALQISAVFNVVSTTASSTGVKLPPTEAGAMVAIFNTGAQTLTVYPPTGSTVDGTTSMTIATGKEALFFGLSDTAWYSLTGV